LEASTLYIFKNLKFIRMIKG